MPRDWLSPKTLTVLAVILGLVVVFGWVYSATRDEPEGPAAASAEPDDRNYVHSTTNVRFGPGTNYDVIAQLAQNEAVVVQSAVGVWSHVRFGDGERGYVQSSLIYDAPAAPPFETMRQRARGMSKDDFAAYSRPFNGYYAQWSGWVTKKDELSFGGYDVWIDMDSPGGRTDPEVSFYLSDEAGRSLRTGQKITVKGKIAYLELMAGSGLQVAIEGARLIEP
jgi:hypothetical protein